MGFEVGDRVRLKKRRAFAGKTGTITEVRNLGCYCHGSEWCQTVRVDISGEEWWNARALERVRDPDPPSREDLLEHLADIRSALGSYAMPGEPLTAAVERLVDRLQSGSATAGAADDGRQA